MSVLAQNRKKAWPKEYAVWCLIRQRTSNPKMRGYVGDKLHICKRWAYFEAFLQDIGPCPPGYMLLQKNKNYDFCRSNCVWAPRAIVFRDCKRAIRLTYRGKTQTACEWSGELGIPLKTIQERHRAGWLAARILSQAVREQGLAALWPREYNVWRAVRRRCLCKTNARYHDYGGRGITLCKRWDSFRFFMADMGLRPVGCSIERLNNNGGYEHENCVWALAKQQQRNRRNTIYLTYKGQTKPVAEWIEITGIKCPTFRARLRLGWSVERIIEDPVAKRPLPRSLTATERWLRDQARTAVQAALHTGKLKRPRFCETSDCLSGCPQAHHHKGYAEEHWLDVVFLCQRCHSLAEGR